MLVQGSGAGGSKGKGKGKAMREGPTEPLAALVDVLVKYTQMTREDVRNHLACDDFAR